LGAASGVTWMILVYFVPTVVVSAVLLAWQLHARRGEALNSADGNSINMFAPVRAPVEV
jgi:hypothetical protein